MEWKQLCVFIMDHTFLNVLSFLLFTAVLVSLIRDPPSIVENVEEITILQEQITFKKDPNRTFAILVIRDGMKGNSFRGKASIQFCQTYLGIEMPVI